MSVSGSSKPTCASWIGLATLALGCAYSLRDVSSISFPGATAQAGYCVSAPTPLVFAVKVGDKTRSSAEDERYTLQSYRFSASAGDVDEHARLRPPADPLAMLDKAISVSVQMISRPEIKTETLLAPNYACGAIVELPGEPGADGPSGSDGCPTCAPIDSNVGLGQPGVPGGNAGPGGRGGDAGPVAIDLAYVDSKEGKLVHARIYGPAGTSDVLFSPAGPKLQVIARGGAGGPGGRGGHGGRGGPNDPERCVRPGTGGPGGHGGEGGPGGRGATVLIRHSAAAPELAALVAIDNTGGPGGSPGKGGFGQAKGIEDPRTSEFKCSEGLVDYAEDGTPGSPGARGEDGPAPASVALPADRLFVASLSAVSGAGGAPHGGAPAPLDRRAPSGAARATPGVARPTAATPPATTIALARTHGGGTLDVAPFEMRDGDQRVLQVSSNGTVDWKGKPTFRIERGIVSTMDGFDVAAVDPSGRIWFASKAGAFQLGSFQGPCLVTVDHVTLKVDKQGSVVSVSINTNVTQRSREKMHALPARSVHAALLVSALMSAQLHFERVRP